MVDKKITFDQSLSIDPNERKLAIEQLRDKFSSIPNKQKAWSDFIRLTNHKNRDLRSIVVEALGSVFSQVPNKQKAWNDLIRLTKHKDRAVRNEAAEALGSAFSHVPNKQKAWNDLHRLINDMKSNARSSAAWALGSVFPLVPDKQKAWNDLLRLTNDENSYVRSCATWTLGSAFSQMPDKQKAWNELQRLNNDKDINVKYVAAINLSYAFSYAPEMKQAWDDLHRLTNFEASEVRSFIALALGSYFYQVPEKKQAWDDLHRFTDDENTSVRSSAALALGSTFSQVPYEFKQQAWNDLHRLINDIDSDVRNSAAFALGSSFSQLPDKQQAWEDLQRLTSDEYSYVRASSYHSLGRVSIVKTSQAKTDEDYKKELEKAIKFFEIAAKESSYYNPALFCLPFYRSFYTIIYQKKKAKEEVNKYLEEAKAAIEDSESKKQLLEAVENLAEALNEVQRLGELDLQGMKVELDFYRKYCDHAAELMKETNEKTPFATEVLRKGLPLLDRNLRELLKEIQEKARTTFQESIGTVVEETAHAVCKEVQRWEIGSQEEMTRYVENLIFSLKSKIPNIPENKNIYDRIDTLKNENDITRQYEILPIIISLIPQIILETRGTVKNSGGIMGTRVLLVTATKVESKAVLDVFQKTTGKEPLLVPLRDQIYHDIGSINGKSVVLVQSEMGSSGLGASLLTVQKAITDLSPDEVIMVGIAFGIDPKKQSIGDILVSKQLMLYELQRVGTKDGNPKIITRGDKAPASTRLLSYFRSVEVRWDESKCKISFGLILSGEKLVDNIDFRQQLCDLYPEAIGGEMEGAGLYVACQDNKIDWIIVKAICDWADGNKGKNKKVKQELAAKNAASFVSHALQLVSFTGRSQELESASGMEPLLINSKKEPIVLNNGYLGTNMFAKYTEDATDKLYKKQQMNEIKNNAKAIDINLAKFSSPKFQQLAELYKNRNRSTLKSNFVPTDPLYSKNDVDFVLRYDISKFDYNLSSAIHQFYNDLNEAENYRLYIENHCKDPNPGIQTICTIKYQDMKATIISCIKKVSEIRPQLKAIYEESE